VPGITLRADARDSGAVVAAENLPAVLVHGAFGDLAIKQKTEDFLQGWTSALRVFSYKRRRLRSDRYR
jgi:hypothetical protein